MVGHSGGQLWLVSSHAQRRKKLDSEISLSPSNLSLLSCDRDETRGIKNGKGKSPQSTKDKLQAYSSCSSTGPTKATTKGSKRYKLESCLPDRYEGVHVTMTS